MRADEPAEDTKALSRARQAYASVGLCPEEKKTFIAQENADFWGATIQGEIGRVRAHREITIRTMTLVVALLQQRTATARVWVAIVGLVVYVSLYARAALSFLDVIFHEAAAFAPGEVFIPSRRARAELAVWLAFVPFMSVDLRAKFDSRVFATDASSRSCAAVLSQLPVGLVQEIWRFRPRRGVGQRFAIVGRERVDSASSSESDVCSESDDDPGDGRWASELCTAVGWQPVFRYTVRRSEHIVTKEARPICTLIRHLASEVRWGGSRVVNFADSSPNIGAWAKGRSSSGRLGRHLRQVAPDLLLTDLQIAIPYVSTKFNPADAPTRGREVRRVPSGRSELADLLLSCTFDDRTDAAFMSTLRDVVPLSDLLESVGSDS